MEARLPANVTSAMGSIFPNFSIFGKFFAPTTTTISDILDGFAPDGEKSTKIHLPQITVQACRLINCTALPNDHKILDWVVPTQLYAKLPTWVQRPHWEKCCCAVAPKKYAQIRFKRLDSCKLSFWGFNIHIVKIVYFQSLGLALIIFLHQL